MKDDGGDWPENARRLSERFPLATLHPHVGRWLERHFRDGPAGVACSGGADSLCLLLLLWAHFPERRGDLIVLHFDHRLRGEESRADACFVEDVARGLRLEIRRGVWEREEHEAVSEDAARTARFAFIGRELSGAGKRLLFLGHHRDDIVESQLMRLSRGSGTAGLAAPRPVQEFGDGRVHLRPLLSLSGVEIRRVLGELKIPFRVDASNEGLGFYRNRIRHEVLPLWQSHSPFDVPAGAAASRELLQEDDEALKAWARELTPEPAPGEPLDIGRLAGKPKAVFRRILREWLGVEGMGERLSKVAFEQLLAAAVAGSSWKMNVGTEIFLELSAAGIVRKTGRNIRPGPALERPWPLPLNGILFLPGGRSLQGRVISLHPAERARITGGQVESRTHAYLARAEERLWVRHWQPGDRYRALGAPGSRKLQDIFVDLKISEEERYLLPVVFNDKETLWVPNLPPAERCRIDTATNRVVQLTYNWDEAV